MPLERLIFATLAGLFAANASCALYKWVDEKGRVQYSDTPPADYGKGGVEMSNRGVIKKKFDAGLPPDGKRANDEETARHRAAQEEALVQRRADNALLQSFSSAAEIDMKRDRELQALDAMISNLKRQERSLLERWNDHKRRADDHAKRSTPLPDELKQDLTRSEGEVRTVRAEIQRRHQESNEVKTKYVALRKRYVELGQPTSAIDAAAAPALPPAKSSTKK